MKGNESSTSLVHLARNSKSHEAYGRVEVSSVRVEKCRTIGSKIYWSSIHSDLEFRFLRSMQYMVIVNTKYCKKVTDPRLPNVLKVKSLVRDK